jgi:hypothetical protein
MPLAKGCANASTGDGSARAFATELAKEVAAQETREIPFDSLPPFDSDWSPPGLITRDMSLSRMLLALLTSMGGVLSVELGSYNKIGLENMNSPGKRTLLSTDLSWHTDVTLKHSYGAHDSTGDDTGGISVDLRYNRGVRVRALIALRCTCAWCTCTCSCTCTCHINMMFDVMLACDM